MILDKMLQKKKQAIEEINIGITKCPKVSCNGKLVEIRLSMRGTGNPDIQGVQCEKCNKIYKARGGDNE